MVTVFHPTGIVKGNVSLPSSKSISNRALIIRAISGKKFSIDDLSGSTDTLTLFKLLMEESSEYDCGDGGTTFRFLLALKALKGEDCVLTGSPRMKQRPIKPLVNALNSLGADIQYIDQKGYPPLKINSVQLTGKSVTIDATVSSQFISALMMIAPQLPEGLTIKLNGSIVSKAYILLTQQLMKYFGVDVIFNNNEIIIPPAKYVGRNIVVEKDWSAASYIFEIAALAKEADILLEGLNLESMQGDRIIAELMKGFGVFSKQEKNGVRITRKANQQPSKFEFDFIDHPDLVMTMAFLCTAKQIPGRFNGIQTLKIKETDRVAALKILSGKFGVDLIEDGNSFTLKPTQSKFESDITLPVFNDHRMAMALAPLSLTFGKLIIEDPDTVKKSYPLYWEVLSRMGFTIQIT